MDLDNLPITERFVRASGPGGQNVNKVASAVELRLDVGKAELPEGVKLRLRVLAGRRLTADDVLLIDSREHRTQAQNREAARARLSALIDLAHVAPKHRQKTKPTKSAKRKRVTEKVLRGKVKSTRGRITGADD
jgi:ribosome-associated protein